MSGRGYSEPRIDAWMQQQAERRKAPVVQPRLKSHRRYHVDARGEATPPPTPSPPAATPSDGPEPSPALSSGRLVPDDARLPVGMVRQLLRTVGETPENQKPASSPNLDDPRLVPGASWPWTGLGAWESSERTEDSSPWLEPSGDDSGVDDCKLFFGNVGLSPGVGAYTPNPGSTPPRASLSKSDVDALLPSLLPSPRPPSLPRVSPPPVDATPKTRCWLKNLPGHLDYAGLFRSLRNAGRIAAASIYHHDRDDLVLKPPKLEGPLPSSDVLLTFCRPTDCRRFVQTCRRRPLCVDGRAARPEPVADRDAPPTTTERAARAAADRGDGTHNAYGARTRVLFVEGPAAEVNRAALRALAARTGVPDDGTVLLSLVHLRRRRRFAHAEWQLASIEAQAQPLHDALARLGPLRGPLPSLEKSQLVDGFSDDERGCEKKGYMVVSGKVICF